MHFHPFVLLFFLIPYGTGGKLDSEKTPATAEGASHETAPLSWVRNEVISQKGRFVTPIVLFRRPHLFRFHSHLIGNSCDPPPKDYGLVFKIYGFSYVIFVNLN